MITEDVGKLILSTQGDVKRFKDQLLAFAENNMSQGRRYFLICFFKNLFKRTRQIQIKM